MVIVGWVGTAFTSTLTVSVSVSPAPSTAVNTIRWLPALSDAVDVIDPDESETGSDRRPPMSLVHATSSEVDGSSASCTSPASSTGVASSSKADETGDTITAEGGVEIVTTTWLVQVAPTSSSTRSEIVWVAADRDETLRVTSPPLVGAALPSGPSTLLSKDACSRSAGTSTSPTSPVNRSACPRGTEESVSGAVMAQLGGLFGGPTVIVVVSTDVSPTVSVTVATRTKVPWSRLAEEIVFPVESGTIPCTSIPPWSTRQSTRMSSGSSSRSSTRASSTTGTFA